MVQLVILEGRNAGLTRKIEKFPCVIGRGPAADVQLEEPGVWEKHLQIVVNPGEGYLLQTKEQASTLLNGQLVKEAVLHNGDLLDVGAVKIQFWLAEVSQRGQKLREIATWSLVLLLSLFQIAVISWLRD